MKRAVLTLLLIVPLLGGCFETGQTATPGQLPPVPADIQQCFRNGSVAIPRGRTLTVAEIESLWKQDRVQIAVMRRCGNRFLAWYESLRQNWK